MGKIDIKNYNNDFLLARASDSELLTHLGNYIYHGQYDFVGEVIVAEREICISLKYKCPESFLEEVANFHPKSVDKQKVQQLPVYFQEHEDWAEVIKVTGMQKVDVIAEICKQKLQVRMFGFLPGFLYIDGLEEQLHVPRKVNPSKYVEANSVALGGKYLGVYPLDSPGGWHIIGKTPLQVLNRNQLPPSFVNVGDYIQIESISEEEFNQIKKRED